MGGLIPAKVNYPATSLTEGPPSFYVRLVGTPRGAPATAAETKEVTQRSLAEAARAPASMCESLREARSQAVKHTPPGTKAYRLYHWLPLGMRETA